MRFDFHRSDDFAAFFCAFHKHFFKEGKGHIVRARRRYEVSAAFYKFHAQHVDVFISSVCVLDFACALAKRGDTLFHAQLDLPEALPVDEIDMCLVLSNLLENALEASLRTAPERRQIRITAYLHAERLLLIEVENAFDGEIKEKDGVFRSSKRRGNGVGIQSVRHIAEKTGGASTFTYQDGSFSAKVMLRS